jgi:hypothetical protein
MPGRRAVAALLLTLYLPSCVYWTATKTPLPELTGTGTPPALMRVTTLEGEKFELQDARVHSDTLIGGAVPDTGWAYIAVADISKVEVKKKSALRTIGTGALILALAYGVAVLCTDVGECTNGE